MSPLRFGYAHEAQRAIIPQKSMQADEDAPTIPPPTTPPTTSTRPPAGDTGSVSARTGSRLGAGTLSPGVKLGTRYTIIKLLGRGGMGAVYQAWDDDLGVAVAIKTIVADADADEHATHATEQRFKRELLLARQVSHKNVVRIHDLGEVDGQKYITMSYIEGETLGRLLKRVGPLPVAQALSYARQIGDGLAAAHEVGIVHRDLKPENVFVTSDERVKILDFGLAKLRPLESMSVDAATRGPVTDIGVVMGTVGYMAPEQVRGEPADHRSDIFAFGAILYELLTGRRAFTARRPRKRSRRS
jgi:eukaryotic-like serine/threonine-protein kinase